MGVVDQFKTTGCVNSEHRKIVRTHTVSCEENKENICASFEIDPSNTVRSRPISSGLRLTWKHAVLKWEGYKTFKSTNVQKLHDGDFFIGWSFEKLGLTGSTEIQDSKTKFYSLMNAHST